MDIGHSTPHLLLLRNGVFLSKGDITMGKYELLSSAYTGDIFEKVYLPELADFRVGRFFFIGMLLSGLKSRFKLIAHAGFGLFVIRHAIARHFRRRKYDFIVTYDPFSAGLLGLLLSRLLNVKLVCEVNGNYGEKKTWADSGRLGWLKFHYCRLVVPFILNRAYAVKLLYPEQLRPFGGRIRAKRVFVFHEYTPVLAQDLPTSTGHYILFLGSPWDIKGVDVLIKAYRKISARFPDFVLKVVGWFPEPGLGFLKSLAEDDPHIQICRPVHYREAMSLVAGCYAVVLPSRSEAMGRVLLEGMAYGKPLIASRVDGIPTYVKEGVNGILVEPEDVEGLADAMAKLMATPEEARKIGLAGREYARTHLSEKTYLEKFSEMLGSNTQ